MDAVASLQEKLKKLDSEVNRLKGKREAVLSQLRDEFGVSTIEEASAILADLRANYDAKNKEYDAAHAAFMQEYGDAIANI